jgi:hypothetical protein
MRAFLPSLLVFAGTAVATVTSAAAALPAQTTEHHQFIASDFDGGDQLGHDVGVHGDTAVMGAPTDEHAAFFGGSAYVFVRDGLDWTEQAKLLGAGITTSDRFGWAVDVHGDTIAVSALFADGMQAVSGNVHIFERTGTAWTQTQVIDQLDGASSDWYGRCLSLSADTLVVGAPQDDDAGNDSGSAYVYTYDGTHWIQQAKLLAADGNTGDNFGQSVSVHGDTILVGAPYDDDNGSNSGSAYLYTRSAGVWTQQTKLIAADGNSSDSFGYAVSLTENRALVGAYQSRLGGFGSAAGAGYVYDRNGVTWTQTAKLTPTALAAGDDLGWAAAIDGDQAVLGARGHNNDTGSYFRFRLLNGVWVEFEQGAASDGASGDQFAMALDLDADRLLVGAYLADPAGAGSAGAAYLYDLFRLDFQPDPPVAGAPAIATISGGTPQTWTYLAASSIGLGTYPIPPLGVVLELYAPFPLGSPKFADPAGTASWTLNVPANLTGSTFWLQGLQMGHVTNLRTIVVQ